MARYTATFRNGETITRNSDNEYTFAWAVFSNGEVFRSGFAGSALLANRAARARKERWCMEDPEKRLRKARTPEARRYILENIERLGGMAAVLARRQADLAAYDTEITEAVRS